MNSSWASKSLKEMEPDPFGAIKLKIQGKKDVINLSSGDPTFPTPSHICKAAYQAIQNGETRYTMTNGIPELRNEIANYYKKFNLDVNPEKEIIVTPGSQQALYLVLVSILDPFDEILVPNPSYTVYSPMIKYLKGKPILFPLNPNYNFHIDKGSLREKVTDNTKAIIICSPNNPTGTVLNTDDLETIACVAKENDLLVISDEIYSEFIWKGEHKSIASLPEMKERSVVIVSFSKTFAMTGWRLGYLIANSELTSLMLDLQGNMILCPSAFVQRAGVAALKGSWDPVKKMAEEYQRRIDYVVSRLNLMEGLKCPWPEGAFYVWIDISNLSNSSDDFCDDLLSEKSVVALSGTNFGSAGEGYIRLALVNPLENLIEAMDRIEDYVRAHY
jgi:aminotransferase